MQLVPVNRNAPSAAVPRAFQQSIGRGRRYRGNFYKEDRNRAPSFRIAGLLAAWGKAKQKAYAAIQDDQPTSTPYSKDQGPAMGSLELSLRYPTGVHVGMDPDTGHFMDDEHGFDDHHDDHGGQEDVWTILSTMHFMVVVSLVIVLDTAQIFLKYSYGLNAVTPAHVEGFFVFLYLVAIVWMVIVIILKRPLPAEQDEEHIDETASNKYLNVGLLFFGTGSCLWKIMSTAAYIEKSGGACGNKGIYAFGSILNVAFTMLQIYYCWRFSKYCIVRWKPLAQMAVMHLMATNVSVWARTVIEEIWEDFILKYIKSSGEEGGYGGGGGGGTDKYGLLMVDPYSTDEHEAWMADSPALLAYGGYGNNNTSTNGTGLDECDPKAGLGAAVYKASVFLYSFTIEYSIIAGAMFYIMWKNIGRRCKPSKVIVNHEYGFSFECGLLMGIMSTMGATIILVLNIIYLGNPEKAYQSFSSYHGFRIILNIVCIIACCMAFVGIHRGGWVVDHTAGPAHVIDAFLLLLCVSGSFLQGFYTLVASAASIGDERFAGLIFFDEFTHIFQTVLQCVLILDAMHRKPPEDFRETRTKQVLMFILVTNITWWLLSTYELKGGYDIFPLENNYYGATAWYVIVHLAAPFDILFRFHSTACFFDIWSFKSVNTNDGMHC